MHFLPVLITLLSGCEMKPAELATPNSTLVEQVLGDADRPGLDELRRSVPVGHVGGVPEIGKLLGGQHPRNGMGDRQATDAGIENADGGLRGQA